MWANRSLDIGQMRGWPDKATVPRREMIGPEGGQPFAHRILRRGAPQQHLAGPACSVGARVAYQSAVCCARGFCGGIVAGFAPCLAGRLPVLHYGQIVCRLRDGKGRGCGFRSGKAIYHGLC